MSTATAVSRVQHLAWSRWFHCESSFDLSLVPEDAGIFVIGLEQPGKKLAVLRAAAVDDLFHALNQLFRADSPLRQEFRYGHCLLRYARVTDDYARTGAVRDLEAWMANGAPSAVAFDFLAAEEGDHPYRGRSD